MQAVRTLPIFGCVSGIYRRTILRSDPNMGPYTLSLECPDPAACDFTYFVTDIDTHQNPNDSSRGVLSAGLVVLLGAAGWALA